MIGAGKAKRRQRPSRHGRIPYRPAGTHRGGRRLPSARAGATLGRGIPGATEMDLTQNLTRLVAAITLAALAGPALARSRPYQPEPGDDSLRSKCRAEVSMIGGTGKHMTQDADQYRALRREKFQACLKAG